MFQRYFQLSNRIFYFSKFRIKNGINILSELNTVHSILFHLTCKILLLCSLITICSPLFVNCIRIFSPLPSMYVGGQCADIQRLSFVSNMLHHHCLILDHHSMTSYGDLMSSNRICWSLNNADVHNASTVVSLPHPLGRNPVHQTLAFRPSFNHFTVFAIPALH
jgi:hypothetical protein